MPSGEGRAPRVFVSSTFIDNEERRRVVEAAILSAGMVPVGMERFTASTRPTVEQCLEQVRGCDGLIGILAYRYGWIPPGQPEGQERSITEMEYDAAEAAGKPRLMFVFDGSIDRGTNGNFDPMHERFRHFKAKLADGHGHRVFRMSDLDTKVLLATLEDCIRQAAQWIRQPSTPSMSIRPVTESLKSERVQDADWELVKELARVFCNSELAILLTTQAGVPREMLPLFTKPLLFWTHIAEEADKGLWEGGICTILQNAAVMYPGNPVFSYHLAVSLTTRLDADDCHEAGDKRASNVKAKSRRYVDESGISQHLLGGPVSAQISLNARDAPTSLRPSDASIAQSFEASDGAAILQAQLSQEQSESNLVIATAATQEHVDTHLPRNLYHHLMDPFDSAGSEVIAGSNIHLYYPGSDYLRSVHQEFILTCAVCTPRPREDALGFSVLQDKMTFSPSRLRADERSEVFESLVSVLDGSFVFTLAIPKGRIAGYNHTPKVVYHFLNGLVLLPLLQRHCHMGVQSVRIILHHTKSGQRELIKAIKSVTSAFARRKSSYSSGFAEQGSSESLRADAARYVAWAASQWYNQENPYWVNVLRNKGKRLIPHE